MNVFDLIVLGVLGISALLAFVRGFLREALGLAAWLGALFVAVRLTPRAEPMAERLLGSAGLAEPVAFALLFLIGLIVLSIAAGIVARTFRATGVGGLDRSVGVLFGVLRGAALISVAYMLIALVFVPKTWPDPVLRARSLPFAYQGAQFLAGLLPAKLAPDVPPPPAPGAMPTPPTPANGP